MKVLLGIGGSEDSFRALERTIDRAGAAGDDLVVSGETDAAIVAVKTPSETALVTPEGGEFEATLDIAHGENQIVVAAATDEDLAVAGTSLTRFTL